MSVSRVRPLVSSAWLQKTLTEHPISKKFKVLDATWNITESGRNHFLKEHIPGAQFFDLNKCVRSCQYRPRELPDEHGFTEYVESLGVSSDTHLVIYDSANMVPASRAWMTFRAYGHNDVSVLDGGFRRWQSLGNDVTSGEPASHERGEFHVFVQKSLIRTFEDMVESSQTRREQILDARNPKHFSGEADEPSPSTMVTLKTMKYKPPMRMSKGHMHNSINLLHAVLVDPDTGCLKPEHQLREVFELHGVDIHKPMSTLCYNGNSASLLALAAAVCGNEQAAVYFASWTEFGQRAAQESLQLGRAPSSITSKTISSRPDSLSARHL